MTLIRLQIRNDTAANWTTHNPILLAGEMGIETDTKKKKVGDGVTAWNSLDYDLSTIPIATDVVLGGIKVVARLTIDPITGVLVADNQSYSLPIADGTTLGGIKVGSRLTISNGVLSADVQSYSLPTAAAATLGGIKVGARLSIDGSGVLSADVQSYTLPTAAAGTLGGVKVGTGLSIDGSGVLSATAQDPTGLTGTTSATFQLDNDVSGPIIRHTPTDTINESKIGIDPGFVFKVEDGKLAFGQNYYSDRKVFDSFDAQFAYDPDASGWWEVTGENGATVNWFNFSDNSGMGGTKMLRASITAGSSGGKATFKAPMNNLIDLMRVTSWFQLGATPTGSSVYKIYTESAMYSLRHEFSRTIPNDTQLMIQDSDPVITSGSYTGNNGYIVFEGLPAGDYFLDIMTLNFVGHNELQLDCPWDRPGTLDLKWNKGGGLSPSLSVDGKVVLSGYVEQPSDYNSNPFGAGFLTSYDMKDSNGALYPFTLIDTPFEPLVEGYRRNYMNIHAPIHVVQESGIGFGNYQDGLNDPYKPSIPNSQFAENADNWVATAGSNVTINSQVWTGGGGQSIVMNITVSAWPGSMKLENKMCKAMMYPKNIQMTFLCDHATNGMAGIGVQAEIYSDWNYEKFIYPKMVETSTNANWRTLAYQSALGVSPEIDDTYEYEDDYADGDHDSFVIQFTDLPVGTYNLRFGGVYFYGESIVCIKNNGGSGEPLSLNITTDEDSDAMLMVERSPVLVFKGSFATAPENPRGGWCYLDTSGTPTMKVYDKENAVWISF